MEQEDQEIKKERELDKMIQRLSRVLEKDAEMRRRLDEATASPNQENLEEILKLMEVMRVNVSEVLPSLQFFEEEVTFMDNSEFPLPENIRSPKVGLIEHAVIEQMERIDLSQHQNSRYQAFNRTLSRKMQAINNAVDICLKNASDKL